MYLSTIVGLLTEHMTARRRHRQVNSSGRDAANCLGGLNDHHLRDIGIVRDRTISPRDHVLWM